MSDSTHHTRPPKSPAPPIATPPCPLDQACVCSADVADWQQGRWVVFFYPRAHTPGCTLQVEQFAALHPQFVAQGWRVVGVSRDGVRAQQRFLDAHRLPYPLISDPDERLCRQFEVMRTKTLYGKAVRGIERSTFLLVDGAIKQAWRKVRADGHAADVLAAVQP